MSNIYLLEPHTSGKVVLHTTQGDVEVELWPKEAPKACRNFVQLCMEGYYDDTIFHRIVAGFIIQGGDPEGTGLGGESIYGKPFQDEFHTRLRFVRRGLVAMANSGTPHDNRSQFFITLDATPELQNKHTIFGKVMGDTIFNVLKIGTLEVDADERPLYPPKITGCTIVINPFDDIVPRITKAEKEAARQRELAQAKGPAITTKPKKMKKNAALLSFGDDGPEEDDQETIPARKIGSSHDVLEDDPTLSKESAPDRIDTEVKHQPSSSSKTVHERDHGREQGDNKRKRTERDNDDRGSSSGSKRREEDKRRHEENDGEDESYNDFDRRMREQVRERMEALKRKAVPEAPAAAAAAASSSSSSSSATATTTALSSAAREQQRQEIEKLQQDVRRMHNMDAQDKGGESKKKREGGKKVSLLELEREKYKTRGDKNAEKKRSSKKGASKADDELLTKLMAFESKLRWSSTAATDDDTGPDHGAAAKKKKKSEDEGPPCELHGISGCQSCQDSVGKAMKKQQRKEARLAGEVVEGEEAISEDDDDDDDAGWMSHKLVFEKDSTKEGSQAGRRDNLDDYVVFDPLDKAAATNASRAKQTEHDHRKTLSATDMKRDWHRSEYRGSDRERGESGRFPDEWDRDRRDRREHRDRDQDRQRDRDRGRYHHNDHRGARSSRR